MTCRVAYICGAQGLPVISVLNEIAGAENFKAFLSPIAISELDNSLKSSRIVPIVSNEQLKKDLQSFCPDIIFVMTYLSKLDVSLAKFTKYGMINIHPSMLPKYRGGAPIFYALKNGEETIGVSYHFMTEEFDQGAIIEQVSIKITPSDCASSAWLKVLKKIITTIPGVIENRELWASTAKTQSESLATSVRFPSIEERSLSTCKTILENLDTIRACGRSTGARLIIGERLVFVTAASATTQPDSTDEKNMILSRKDEYLLIRAADGWLRIDEAKLDGKTISSWNSMMDTTPHDN